MIDVPCKLTTINLLYWLHISTHMLRTNTLKDRSDEGLTLETLALLPFTVANLRLQLS